jgi:dihydropyrimidine dehydrogenase (NAD+) subunit PreA
MNLRSNFCGLELENPFVLASAPPTASIEMIERAFEAGWAGVVTKTIKPDSLIVEDASPRFYGIREGDKVIGFENYELVSKKDLAYWGAGIQSLRKNWPEKIIIVSIMGEPGKESWQELAKWAEKMGAHALELNFSCPHGMPEIGGGAAIGQNVGTTKTITQWVKEATKLPVMVKLTPNVTSVTDLAQAALDGGADALAAINTVEAIMGVDLDNLTPYPYVGNKSAYGGYSGAGVKPIGLRVISQLYNYSDTPLSGMGGINTWEDALEYIALGASHIQVCTAVMVSGFKIVKPMLEGMKAWMKSKGYESLDEICGVAARKMSSHQELVKSDTVYPKVDHEACIRCGKCIRACDDGAYQAIRFENKKIEINQEKCDGCGLCAVVCPVGAISLPQGSQRIKAPTV